MGEFPQKHGPNTPAPPSIQVLDYRSPSLRPPSLMRSNVAASIAGLSALILLLFFLATAIVPFSEPAVFLIPVFLIPVFSILALIFGIVGFRRARRQQLPGAGAAVAGILWGIIFLLLLALIAYSRIDAYYSYGRGGPISYRFCQSHLDDIGWVAGLHARGTGKYPTLAELLIQLNLGAEKLVCPASGDSPASGETVQEQLADLATPGHCSYIYLGLGLDPKKVTPKTILAYESLANHESGMNVLYADGTVEWVRLKRAKQILAELKAGRNPPNLPQ